MNPVRGGKPPNERSTRGVSVVRTGVLAQEVASALTVVALLSLKTRNIEIVIARYVTSVRRVRVGENCKTSTIQPKCAMDE